MGVPVTASRKSARSPARAANSLDEGFLACWASSRITPAHSIPAYASAFSRRTVAEVTTMSWTAASSATVVGDLLSVAERRATRSEGTNLRASASQLGTTDEGATTRNGPGEPATASAPEAGAPAVSCACAISASAWTVLPSPMSSARIPPIRWRHSMASQSSPCCWYGRSSASNAAGTGTGSGVSEASSSRACARPVGGARSSASSARSAHSPAWPSPIRMSPASPVSPARAAEAASASSRSVRSSPKRSRSTGTSTPSSVTNSDCPLTTARKTAANGTGRPSTVTPTDSPSQSMPDLSSSAATLIRGPSAARRISGTPSRTVNRTPSRARNAGTPSASSTAASCPVTRQGPGVTTHPHPASSTLTASSSDSRSARIGPAAPRSPPVSGRRRVVSVPSLIRNTSSRDHSATRSGPSAESGPA